MQFLRNLNETFSLTMLSWIEEKTRQKNERQKNGVWHHAGDVDNDGMEPRKARQTFFCPPSFCLPNVFAVPPRRDAMPIETSGRSKDREIESLT